MKKIYYGIVIVLILVAMLLPNISRIISGNGSIISDAGMEEAYSYAHYASDSLGVPENLYALLLLVFSKVVGVIMASKLLPLVLGLISLVFLYLLLSKLEFETEIPVILLVLAFSPVFLYLVSVSVKTALLQTILMSGIYFLIRKKGTDKIISVVLFSLLGMFNLYSLLIPLFGLFFFSLIDKRKRNVFLLLLMVSVLIVSFTYLPAYLVGGELGVEVSFDSGLFDSYISDFGGAYGVSVFALLLFFFGIFFTWGAKKKYGYLYLYSLLIVVGSLFVRDLLIFANVIISFYAGIAVVRLLEKRWHFRELKFFTLLLIVCSLLFSALVASQTISSLEPSSELVETLEWLNSEKKGLVLTSPELADILEFYGLQPYISNSYTDFDNRLDVLTGVFYAQDIKTLRVLLKKNKIEYILITPSMRTDLWDGEEGLLFLFRNDETFKKEQQNNGIEVWKVK